MQLVLHSVLPMPAVIADAIAEQVAALVVQCCTPHPPLGPCPPTLIPPIVQNICALVAVSIIVQGKSSNGEGQDANIGILVWAGMQQAPPS